MDRGQHHGGEHDPGGLVPGGEAVREDHGWNSGSMGTSGGRRFGLTIAVILALGTLAASGIVLLVIRLLAL